MSERPLLDPELPYAMGPRIAAALADPQLLRFVHDATTAKDAARKQVCAEAFGARYEALKAQAAARRQATLDDLDRHLGEFVRKARAAGVQIHFAADAAAARAIVLGLAQRIGAKLCVKAKSMATEEIQLLPALEAAGIETLETDLGEFIVQIDHDAPSHIVMPMIHKDRAAAARALQRATGAEYTEDPGRLTRIAREHMRAKYRRADLGISGANFLIAETGSLVLCTNEGNADFCVAGPRVHVAVAGIEKVIEKLADLPLFVRLLARSATAQPQTVYTTTITGPRRPGEHDGPEEVHIVLLDNGRRELLRPATRELLRCIRCGACLNACPVYRKVGGGHAYGAVYSGPIGAVLMPGFRGVANYPDLPQASSLCGACKEACPVGIDIPAHLIRLRGELQRSVLPLRLAAWVLRRPWWFRWALHGARLAVRVLPRLGAWAREREFPRAPREDFRTWWRSRR